VKLNKYAEDEASFVALTCDTSLLCLYDCFALSDIVDSCIRY